MNKRLVSVLIFAAVVALGASLLFYRLVASRISSAPKPATAQVVVAARVLAVGTLIKEPDITVAGWAGPVPQNAITKKEDVVGRGVISTIYQSEPIVDSRLAPKGAGAGLAATIPQGMRAVAVKVNEIIGVAGFVVPGMRVDVLISGAPPGSPPNLGTLAKTLLQNIEVLSAGHNIQKDNEGKPISVPVVNLLVTPEQAEVLSLASTETKIQLVLRNPLDTEVAKTTGTSEANLFAGQKLIRPEADGVKPAARVIKRVAPVAPVVQAAPPKPQPVVVEVIQGGKKSEFKFQGQPEANQ